MEVIRIRELRRKLNMILLMMKTQLKDAEFVESNVISVQQLKAHLFHIEEAIKMLED